MLPKRLLAITLGAALAAMGGRDVRAQWVQTNGPLGGRVTCLALAGDTVYAGSSGGVFRSLDSGLHWQNLNSPPAVNAILLSNSKIFTSCGEHVFVTSNDGAKWVEADSGLPSNFETVSLVGNGSNLFTCPDGNVYRSTNAGVSWLSDSNTNENLYFSSLFMAGQNLFAGVPGMGTFLSTNYGKSWSKMNGELGSVEMSSLISNGSNFIASAAGFLLFSNDSGLTWPVTDTFPDISAFTLKGSNIYVSTGEGIYVSSDAGLTWRRETPGVAFNILAISGNLVLGAGEGISRSSDSGSTWVSSDSGLIAIANQTIASDQKTLFVGTQNGISTSTDDGTSWLSEDSGLITGYENVRKFFVDSDNVYACGGSVFSSRNGGLNWTIDSVGLPLCDVFDLTRSGNTLWTCTDHSGIVFYSTDNGQSWISDSAGLPVPTAYGAAITGIGSNVFVGLKDEFGLFSSSNFGPWLQMKFNQKAFHGINCFLTVGTNLFAGFDVDEVFISSDSGLSWTNVSNGLPSDESSFGGGVSSLLSVDGALFAGSEFGVYISTNNGNSWKAVSSGLTNTAIQGLASQDGFLFAATAGSGIWRRPLSDFGISAVSEPQPTAVTIRNYPNPFSQSTTISFSSPASGYADVTIVNPLGTEVARLFSGELAPGAHQFIWSDPAVPDGMYECVVRMNGRVEEAGMVRIR